MRAFLDLIWVSPVRDITGFMWRYWLLGAAIAVIGIGGAVVSDQSDRYLFQRLWHSVLADGAYFYGRTCNFVIAARSIFFLLAFMELATVVGLLVAGFRRRSATAEVAGTMPRAATSLRTVSMVIVAILALSFLHLGLYAIAFHYDHCTRWTGVRQFRAYGALAAFSVLYGMGSSIVIGCCLIGLRRSFPPSAGQ